MGRFEKQPIERKRILEDFIESGRKNCKFDLSIQCDNDNCETDTKSLCPRNYWMLNNNLWSKHLVESPEQEQIGGDHYKNFVIQPSEFILRNKLGWLEGNVIKYVCRHSFKNGAEDIRKGIHYLKLILKWVYGN